VVFLAGEGPLCALAAGALDDRSCGSVASIQSIAGALGVNLNKASATLSELEDNNLAQISNGGIRLTPAGRESALHTLRAHRMWERYLADETGYSEQEWHDLAERYEHELTPSEVEALSAKLGYPTWRSAAHRSRD